MANNQRILPGHRARIVSLLCLVLVPLVGCGKQTQEDGQTLAKAGVATSNNLAAYYHSLADDTLSEWELTAYVDAVVGRSPGKPLRPEIAKDFQDRLDALRAREDMARQLASTYNSLLQISSYDASGAVKSAAGKLADEVTALRPLPGGQDPKPLFADTLGELASVRQSGDIKKGGKAIGDLISQTSILFHQERPAYVAIEDDRDDLINDILSQLIKNKQVLPLSLIEAVPQSLGLKWAHPNDPVDDRTNVALIQVAQVRTKRMALDASAAAGATEQSLSLLVDKHRAFLTRRPQTIDDILAAVLSAQGYLDDIAKLRGDKSL